MSRWLPALALALGLGACVFAPDLSRFDACDDQGRCAEGFTCLETEGVCLPDCSGSAPCAPGGSPPEGGEDSGPGDGGIRDAGGLADGGGTPDAGGTPDGGPGPFVLVAESLGDGLETASYPHRFQAQGGVSPYSFSVVTGALPTGLMLSAVGDVSGKPTQAGSYSFSLEAVDAAGTHARQDFSLRVRALLRMAGPTILADFPSGKAYTEQLSATGGSPPYLFELVTSGTPLPTGLALHDRGQVEGTSSGGASTFQVLVTDSGDPAQSVTRTLQLTPSSCAVGTPCVRTRAVPDGRVGQFYTYTFQASSNTSSATWTVDTGTQVPPGLSLDAPSGVLSGTPTQAGSTDFSVTLTNFVDKKNFSVTLRIF